MAVGFSIAGDPRKSKVETVLWLSYGRDTLILTTSYWLHRSALFSGRRDSTGQEKQLRAMLEPWIPQSLTKKDTSLICKKEKIEAASFSQTVPRCYLCIHTHLPARHASFHTCVNTIPMLSTPFLLSSLNSLLILILQGPIHMIYQPLGKQSVPLAVFCKLPEWLANHIYSIWWLYLEKETMLSIVDRK